MQKSLRFSAVVGLFVCVGVAFWASQGIGYSQYDGSNNCVQCHDGFVGGFGNPLHDMHVGSAKITNNCTLCHTSVGDNPKLDSSGTDASHGCTGCHMGVGLRLHHANAGAPADGLGLTCVACHAGDPTPPAENVKPPYYTRTDVNVSNPCLADSTQGGEDWNGDGHGLDNDGDLLYDTADSDCSSEPVERSTWGAIKSTYK